MDMVVATDLAFVLFLLVIFQSSYNYRDLWLPYPPWTNFIFHFSAHNFNWLKAGGRPMPKSHLEVFEILTRSPPSKSSTMDPKINAITAQSSLSKPTWEERA